MPEFNVRLTKQEGLRMVADVTVEAADEAQAREKAIAWGRDEDNEHEWSEQDSSDGSVEVEAISPAR